MLVPVLIAGLIILNTMLGSVHDRLDEIHTYTAVGLAPVHIGALFISEAAAFATLGVVGGFILGQGFGTVATHLGWLEAITLNYGGLAAAFCMFFVGAVVLLSTIYPARMGAKLASPSEVRTWRLPPAENDVIHTELPFTIDREMAEGVCAFLVEWIGQHREASVGGFATGAIEVYKEGDDRDLRGIVSQIWLAPFDLGVMQTFHLEIAPTEHSGTYQVLLWLRREDGEAGPWIRANRGFVADLRKQFLLWRILTIEQRTEYQKRSADLFAAEVEE